MLLNKTRITSLISSLNYENLMHDLRFMAATGGIAKRLCSATDSRSRTEAKRSIENAAAWTQGGIS